MMATYDKTWRVEDLKEECRRKGLLVGGNKADLLDRLNGAATPVAAKTASGRYDDSWRVEDLKEECRRKGLLVGGNKADLLDRLNGAPAATKAAAVAMQRYDHNNDDDSETDESSAGVFDTASMRAYLRLLPTEIDGKDRDGKLYVYRKVGGRKPILKIGHTKCGRPVVDRVSESAARNNAEYEILKSWDNIVAPGYHDTAIKKLLNRVNEPQEGDGGTEWYRVTREQALMAVETVIKAARPHL